jgi:hypothetical protein
MSILIGYLTNGLVRVAPSKTAAFKGEGGRSEGKSAVSAIVLFVQACRLFERYLVSACSSNTIAFV